MCLPLLPVRFLQQNYSCRQRPSLVLHLSTVLCSVLQKDFLLHVLAQSPVHELSLSLTLASVFLSFMLAVSRIYLLFIKLRQNMYINTEGKGFSFKSRHISVGWSLKKRKSSFIQCNCSDETTAMFALRSFLSTSC